MSSARPSSPLAPRQKQQGGFQPLDVMVPALAGLLMWLSFNGADDYAGKTEPDVFIYLLIVLSSVALIWRRQRPIAVMIVVYVAMAIMYTIDYGVYAAEVGLPAVYTVARFTNDRRRAWLSIVLCTAALLAAGSTGILAQPDTNGFANGLMAAAYVGVGAVAGAAVRNRESIFSDAEVRAKQAETDRVAEATLAVAKERRRIAREMHDIVAHGMSVIAVQAGAAQQIVHADPEKGAVVLGRIEDTARQSLAEMRRMLGVLREDDDPAIALTPQPRLAEIVDIVAQAVASGAPTKLVISGHERELPPGIELAAYRITQEALTNVRKHGGKSATSVVCLDYQSDSIVVEVTDDGRGAISKLSRIGSGNGLIGMRERVEIYGGQLHAGPVPGGGYSVRAVLPLDSLAAGATPMNGQQS